MGKSTDISIKAILFCYIRFSDYDYNDMKNNYCFALKCRLEEPILKYLN
jgi:hypothetical protein